MLERFRSSKVNVQPQIPLTSEDCANDPIESLRKLFVDIFQGAGLRAGRDPATRPVFLRLHGVAHGQLLVRKDLPQELQVGVFGQQSEYHVWVRMSSDVQPGRPDLKGTVGISIKLFGVNGKKLMSPDEGAVTHDFIMQNHDVFFVDNASEMCEFTRMALNGQASEYIEKHPVTGQVLNDMEKTVDSVLATEYWSVLPYRFGDRYVKYKLEPETYAPSAGKPNYDDPFYLRADVHERMKKGEARFRFLLQFQTTEAQMPLDRATVRWSEKESPPIHVATLVLAQQDLGTRGQATYGENLAFNPWHCIAEHEPIGSISAARKVVYQASANVRRNFNGVPLAEPKEPRPKEWTPGMPYPHGRDTRIVRAAIHPAIGVARVGNSRDGFFYCPEVVDAPPIDSGYRDGSGALKRQAARFRLYGYNAQGEVVGELTADSADIRWSVEVANRKAAWYEWQIALDIPQANNAKLPLRNKGVADRESLVIKDGPHAIHGRSTKGREFEFWGKFLNTNVYLGEVRTDDAGHLIVLGGRGVSASPTGSPIFDPVKPNGFINADGWYDDVCDGPVTAEVNIAGRPIPVESAWVVTAPPNYAPTLIGVRTLYDLLKDLFVQNRWLPRLEKVSFRRDVYPILNRLTKLQWVNQGFATQFGRGGPHDFEDADYVAKLAKASSRTVDIYAELRRQILNSFREPRGEDGNQLPWPWLYGDGMEIPAVNTPQQNAAISGLQYQILQSWAVGNFVSDWDADFEPVSRIEQVDLADQPAMLDRAALEDCLADAFHPGCEVTWTIRHLSMFSSPFRIRHRGAGKKEPDFGPTLTPEQALAPDGPLNEQGPGDLTKWMGLPWQADTAFCRSGYDSDYDPYVPTFWPARVPNQVLTRAAYDIIRDHNNPREYRLAVYNTRMEWVEPLSGTIAGQMEDMVRVFGSMGLLEILDGIDNDPDFPSQLYVASFGPDIPEPSTPLPKVDVEQAKTFVDPKHISPPATHRVGWGTKEQRRQVPLPVRHPDTNQ